MTLIPSIFFPFSLHSPTFASISFMSFSFVSFSFISPALQIPIPDVFHCESTWIISS